MEKSFPDVLEMLFPLSEQAVSELSNMSRTREYRKGEYFIRAGEKPDKFGFTLSGLFRYYYADANGHEFTKGFFPEGSVISSYSAMIQNRESYFSVEALEDSVVQVITRANWNKLLSANICWKEFLIAMLEKGYCAKESRERDFLLLDAESRYRKFLQAFPGMENRIKQHLIASYLGITPVALSRIRRKMGIVNTG